jgi:hypothetical protein
MISTGAQLSTFITSLNSGAAIDADLLDVLVNTARTIIEEERPWMVLRKTDTSLSLTTSNTWQTAKSLSTITDFSRFYSDTPIRLFDGSNRIDYYRQVPFDRRLEYKDAGGTFVYDENAGNLYFNGVVAFNGTLYLNYLATSTAIDLTSASAVWSLFPSRFLPLLGFYAIGIYQGGVDYDTISARQSPQNFAVMQSLKNAMEKWDDERALSTLDTNDPTDLYAYPRLGTVNRYDS